MSSVMPEERSLRLVSLFSTVIATPLVIASTAVSIDANNKSYWHRPATAFCFGYIPLALTVLVSVASLKYQRKYRLTDTPAPARTLLTLVDLLSGLAYLGVLIPIWAIEIRFLEKPGLGLLAGYTTAPMIINMFVHAYFFCYYFKSLHATFTGVSCRQCPSCRNKFVNSASETKEAVKGGAGYSLLRAENYLDSDDDAVVYSDARISTDLRPEDLEAAKGKEVEI